LLHLLALPVIYGLIWVAFVFVLFILLGGWDLDDMRSVLLYRAWRSFTHEGELIPGRRPSLVNRLVIRALSREDDAKKALVAAAMGVGGQSNRYDAAG
jgi:hypothetical protein